MSGACSVDPSAPGLEQLPLPLWLRVPDALERRVGISVPDLRPETITRAVGRRLDHALVLPDRVEEALEVLCRSLRDEARLQWFGRMNYWNLMVTGLTEMARVEQAHRRDPSLRTQALRAPIIVTGMPRSGTTFLHRLLCAPKSASAVTLARHLFPSPRRWPTARLEAEAIFFGWKRASQRYGMDAIHFMRPALPDECTFGMRLDLHSMLYWSTAPAYSYLDWVLDRDMSDSYRLYRRVLQLHQARAPEQRLVLKCPHHMAWLPALAEALPEALLVMTHRDPRQLVGSECKLNLSLHALATESLDWPRTVSATWHKASTYAARAIEFADSPAGARVIHVDYRRLLSEPAEVAAEVYARCGIAVGAAQAATLKAYARSNRQHKRGQNRYSLEQFGLSPQSVDKAFAGYRRRFVEKTEPA